jgi:hypothetical protein
VLRGGALCSERNGVLPPRFRRVLDIWAARDLAASHRAADYLSRWLAPELRRGTFVSPLTRTGDPFEPAFAAGTTEIRYTVHLASSAAPAEQLSMTLDMLRGSGLAVKMSPLLDAITSLQRLGEVKIGAQVGVRHCPVGDRLKLYVEVPTQAATAAEAIATRTIGQKPVLDMAGRSARLCLVGGDLTTDRTEFYYRVENLHPREISTLLARGGCGDRASGLLALINRTQKVPLRHTLPGSLWGMSYTCGVEGVSAVTIYTFASTLFGPDHLVRSGISALADTYCWDLGDYAAVSRTLAKAHNGPLHHGMIGFVVRPDCAILPWIGVAPPACYA